MNISQLDRIETLLMAQAKSENRTQWIGGYVYGRTGNDDPFVILYPSSDYLKEKACRVYDHDFKKLPAFIDTSNVPADTEANPNKTQAQKKGIYHKCPLFQIVLYNGRETQMGPEKRFGGVLRVSGSVRTQTPSPAPQPVRTQTPPPPADDAADIFDPQQAAVIAHTAELFHQRAYELLGNGLYSKAADIASTMRVLNLPWQPSELHNIAMIESLKAYRAKRQALERSGEPIRSANSAALTAARDTYRQQLATAQQAVA